MKRLQTVSERELTHLAKRLRENAGHTRAEAARQMGVSQTSIFQAEELPEQALAKLRVRMIEAYSRFRVKGPVYLLQAK